MMTDLHAWITTQVDRVEAITHGQWSPDWELEAFPTQAPNLVLDRATGGVVAFVPTMGAGQHIVANDPGTVLRRCAADRRILGRHRADPDDTSPRHARTCRACNYTNRIGMMSVRLAVDLADCPELLDLAHAHGITDEILAGLDRPRRSPIEPWGYRRTDTADVPASLRGLNWKGQP